ncbi:MAG: proton-conducting transporter membrane subunit [Clostridiaceae bacterium]|nr:proton-conducting transporter membrane subunit [Clostridiaceae bacterium]
MNELILLIPIFLPLAAGIAAAFLPALKRDRALYPFVTVVLLVNAAAVIALACLPETRLTILGAGTKFAIAFQTDGIARLFSVISSLAWLITAVYSYRYMEHEDAHPRFYAFYLIVIGLINALDYSATLITMYLCYEFMTLCSLPLVLHSLTKEAISAGLKYLFYSIAGAMMALFGFFCMYAYANTLDFKPGGVMDSALLAGHEPLFLAGVFAVLIGLCTKAGMFPMHAWLPTAHPIAPAPASAQLSAVITKAGVLCVIRTVFFIAGADRIAGTWVQYTWIILTLITIFMGSMMAYRERGIKKRLAYSTVSQVSYALLGLALLTPEAIVGSLLHVVFHMAAKSALFLCAGSIIFETGKTRTDELRGLGISMPVTFWCWTLAALTLIGIPPTSAFLSKWYLATAALSFAGTAASGLPAVISWLAPVILLVSALLTAGYLLPVTVSGFFPGREFDRTKVTRLDQKRGLTIPVCVFTAAAVLLGIYAEPLIRFLTQISL